ncbi:hypothetical protein [Bacillus sp. EB600]|uniref:hypothetical protein n=1 Tax=Bacillus sp. EB600 TaxID=2806345 RepID=UPI00210DFE04|nr:hypothetical protein [Bacillus sp. EB600]MCQ6282647.1 hypothetical protein [Bacillus sp. EB600]
MTEIVKQNKGDPQDKVKEAYNSSMAQDFSEIKKLGKEMKAAKTGSELQKANLTSDPIQYNDKTVEELISTLVVKFDDICSKLTVGITIAGEKDDQSTAGMFEAIRTSLENYKGMLKTYLVEVS